MTMSESARTPVASFGARMHASVHEHGPIVVGIDPHAGVLEAWGLDDSARGARTLSEVMLEACEGRVAAIKPQSAFFERYGSAGIAVLEDLLAAARARGVLTILDVKRGDIGSTMAAYADAYLRPGAPLEADAITVSPFLGFGSLQPCAQFIRENGKGIYVLALTSNPDGPQVQHAHTDTRETIAETMSREAARLNRDFFGSEEWGSVGLVVGATIGDGAARARVDLARFNGTFLSPGFGAQGAGPEDKAGVFGAASDRVLVSMSRSILNAGPSVSEIRLALDEAVSAYTE